MLHDRSNSNSSGGRSVIELSEAGLGDFKRTRSKVVEGVWMIAEWLFVTNSLQPSSSLRCAVLRLFGASIGPNVTFRPRTRVKFPWNLAIGRNAWIGEGVWIHNQGRVTIGDNCVVSQESFITTGSHLHRTSMDLVIKPVVICPGAWITTRCIILQGVTIGRNAVVTPGSVVVRNLSADQVFGGNPAVRIMSRWPEE